MNSECSYNNYIFQSDGVVRFEYFIYLCMVAERTRDRDRSGKHSGVLYLYLYIDRQIEYIIMCLGEPSHQTTKTKIHPFFSSIFFDDFPSMNGVLNIEL